MMNNMCKNCARLGIDCKGTECQTWSGCVYKENAQQTLKRMMEELERLEEIANKADDEMMADPTNEEKEKAFDEAYKAEFEAFTAVASLIVKMTSGQIDEKTARTMVRAKRKELMNIVA